MGVLSNKIDREQLNLGDHIYSWRQAYIYAHHGIYVGLGMVIHFTRGKTASDCLSFSSPSFHATEIPCPTCGDQTRSDGVIASCLDCFLSGGHLYRFEYGVSIPFFIAQARGGTCTIAPSDSASDVLHRAYLLLENGFRGYHALKNNCEDFAIYCKTGLLVNTEIGLRGQAAPYSIVRQLISNGFDSLPLICFDYCIDRYFNDIGVRSDVAKVPVEKLIAEMKTRDGGTITRHKECLVWFMFYKCFLGQIFIGKVPCNIYSLKMMYENLYIESTIEP